MKYTCAVIAYLSLADPLFGFAPHSPLSFSSRQSGHQQCKTSSSRFMSMDMVGVNTLDSTPPAIAAPPAIVQEQAKPLPTIQPGQYGQPSDVKYTDFVRLVNADRIEKVTFSSDGSSVLGVDVDGTRFKIAALPNDPSLLSQLSNHNVDVSVLPAQQSNGLGSLVQSLLFPAVLFAGLFFLSRRAGGGGNQSGRGGNRGTPAGFGGLGGFLGGNNPMNFGKSKSEVQMVPDTGVTFDDVAGCEGSKDELVEVVDFLKNPETYTKNGCKIPKGVILEGPPGTGKTLLAKAVAGEAGVPFIATSGSEFVEMFVGVGASRVRDIFDKAKKNAPCIIFIDEIDAIGRQRGSGNMGGNDEREQTINQFLIELDGYEGNKGIICMAATNRADVLDQALLRPGRFDRRVSVPLPDYQARIAILGVHGRNKPLEPDVDFEAIARRIPGYSGAQIQNLLNEAAIAAVRNKKNTIGWEEVDNAVDRIMVGLERKGGMGSKAKKKKMTEIVAFHEAGHAIIGALVPDYDLVQKISIVPRSNGAGGLTFFAPLESRAESGGNYNRQYLESQLAVAFGGRLAEELTYGEDIATTGASNDLLQIRRIAKAMVRDYGLGGTGTAKMTKRPRGQQSLRAMMNTGVSVEGSEDVDVEVERLINNAYLLGKKILSENLALLEHLAGVLLEREVVSAEEFQMMLVQFDAKSVDYDIYGKEMNREKMPFQAMPAL